MSVVLRNLGQDLLDSATLQWNVNREDEVAPVFKYHVVRA